MDIEYKWTTRTLLDQLVTKLSGEKVMIYGPVTKDELTEFAEVASFSDINTEVVNTNQSAKSVVFPKYESLFQIIREKGSISLIQNELEKLPEIVTIGTRPCDARGLQVLNTIFDGEIKDQIYLGRLSKLTTISIACTNHDNYCFCTSLQSGPGSVDGSDILLTPDEEDGFFVEVITEKGKKIVESLPDCFEEAKDFDKESHLAKVPVVFDSSKFLGKLGDRFEDAVWVEQSLRCIGCGTCAYVCPTCGCFDIQDVSTPGMTQRKRSWDSCGFDLFTLHASGHNPRNIQSKRWRQRIFHKFQYMPESDNVAGCVGCGRCSRTCSVDMNLKTHLTKLADEF